MQEVRMERTLGGRKGCGARVQLSGWAPARSTSDCILGAPSGDAAICGIRQEEGAAGQGGSFQSRSAVRARIRPAWLPPPHRAGGRGSAAGSSKPPTPAPACRSMRPTFSASFSSDSSSFSRRSSLLSSISFAVLASDRVAAVSSWRRIKLAFAVRSASTTLLISSADLARQDHVLDPKLIDHDAKARPFSLRDKLAQVAVKPVACGQNVVERTRGHGLTDRELRDLVERLRHVGRRP